MRTMKEMCQEALDVQNAYNLSGVIHAWSRLFPDLRAQVERLLDRDFTTEKLNQHPVCILFSSKVADLTHSERDGGQFRDAYEFAKQQTK